MPELPEMEIVKNKFSKKLIGAKIKKIDINYPKSFQADPKQIEGQEIIGVWRRAKIVGFDLENGLSLLFHLKLTGQLILIDGKKRFNGGHPTPGWEGEMPNGSTRVIFEFSDGQKLYFNDQIKFGWIKVVPTDDLEKSKELSKLGPEPLDESFTAEIFRQRIGKHQTWPIKLALMDQSSIAGVGNIYANEALFEAKIDPKREVSSLSDKDWQNLYEDLIKVLNNAIKVGGSGSAYFINSRGEKGMFLDFVNVYNRDGDPCKVCGTIIKRSELGGRGTYYCPNCQK